MHCVTTWSRLDNAGRGVAFKDLVGWSSQKATPPTSSRIATPTTREPLGDILAADDVMIAIGMTVPSSRRSHGGRVRLSSPGAMREEREWLEAWSGSSMTRPRFWERNGYNNARRSKTHPVSGAIAPVRLFFQDGGRLL